MFDSVKRFVEHEWKLKAYYDQRRYWAVLEAPDGDEEMSATGVCLETALERLDDMAHDDLCGKEVP